MKHAQFSVLAKSLIAAAAALTFGSAQAVSTVQVTAPASVSIGDVFNVSITGAGFEPVIGGGLNVSFGAGLLELLAVTIDPAWSFWTDAGTIDNAAGTLTDAYFNVWGQKSGDFGIATLQFKALAAGQSAITLAPSEIFDFSTPMGETPAINLLGSNVQINSPVPEPGSWLLLLGGLGLLGAAAARRSA
jgi:hypothetical protein